MHYTTQTPINPDHIIDVIGIERFIANFDKPPAEWGLTPDECAAILRGPHGQKALYFLDSEYMGLDISEWVVDCQCGKQFTDRLVSVALRAYETHAEIAPTSHIHTAEMLED